MINRPPSVTVLMTVFNAGRFLEPSIRSIIDQVFRDWEFVIVDDASTDGSAEVAKAWAAKDSRVRVVANEHNKGQTACLNQGLALARGRWIARQDADDLSHPLRLLRQHELVLVAPELQLIGTSGRIIDENDRMIGLLDVPLEREDIDWTGPFLNPFLHTSVMVRTSVIREEFGGYDESFRIAQDYDLWTRIAVKHPSANLAARLVGYRHMSTSLSKTGRDLAFKEADRVSLREAQRVFGTDVAREEAELLSCFRKGLTPDVHGRFWKFYSRHYQLFKPAPSNVAAMHRLKSAGAVGGLAAIGDIWNAFRLNFPWTLSWFRERYF